MLIDLTCFSTAKSMRKEVLARPTNQESLQRIKALLRHFTYHVKSLNNAKQSPPSSIFVVIPATSIAKEHPNLRTLPQATKNRTPMDLFKLQKREPPSHLIKLIQRFDLGKSGKKRMKFMILRKTKGFSQMQNGDSRKTVGFAPKLFFGQCHLRTSRTQHPVEPSTLEVVIQDLGHMHTCVKQIIGRFLLSNCAKMDGVPQ